MKTIFSMRSSSPSPTGRGRGEGVAINTYLKFCGSIFGYPHPSPLPKGEGIASGFLRVLLLVSIIIPEPTFASEAAFVPSNVRFMPLPPPSNVSHGANSRIVTQPKFFPINQSARIPTPMPIAGRQAQVTKETITPENNGREVGKKSTMSEENAKKIIDIFAEGK